MANTTFSCVVLPNKQILLKDDEYRVRDSLQHMRTIQFMHRETKQSLSIHPGQLFALDSPAREVLQTNPVDVNKLSSWLEPLQLVNFNVARTVVQYINSGTYNSAMYNNKTYTMQRNSELLSTATSLQLTKLALLIVEEARREFNTQSFVYRAKDSASVPQSAEQHKTELCLRPGAIVDLGEQEEETSGGRDLTGYSGQAPVLEEDEWYIEDKGHLHPTVAPCLTVAGQHLVEEDAGLEDDKKITDGEEADEEMEDAVLTVQEYMRNRPCFFIVSLPIKCYCQQPVLVKGKLKETFVLKKEDPEAAP